MTQTEEQLQPGPTAPATPTTWRHYLELTKPRLSFMSVITAMVGYLAALPFWDWLRTFYVMLGTALCAGGVAALNQWMESDLDAKMKRTADRPIPTGHVQPGSAFIVGWLMCIAGLAVLFRQVNGMSAFLALATIVAYLAIYTPAKRWSRWNTEIGAISGALPFGITHAPLTFDPPLSDGEELASMDVPSPGEGLVPYKVQAEPARRLPALAQMPILVLTAEASWMAADNHAIVHFLRQAGASVEHVRLEDRGVHGNGQIGRAHV